MTLFYPTQYDYMRKKIYYAPEVKLWVPDAMLGNILIMLGCALASAFVVFIAESGIFQKC